MRSVSMIVRRGSMQERKQRNRVLIREKTWKHNARFFRCFVVVVFFCFYFLFCFFFVLFFSFHSCSVCSQHSTKSDQQMICTNDCTNKTNSQLNCSSLMRVKYCHITATGASTTSQGHSKMLIFMAQQCFSWISFLLWLFNWILVHFFSSSSFYFFFGPNVLETNEIKKYSNYRIKHEDDSWAQEPPLIDTFVKILYFLFTFICHCSKKEKWFAVVTHDLIGSFVAKFLAHFNRKHHCMCEHWDFEILINGF